MRKEGNGSWYLRIQEYYSRLLDYVHPMLLWKRTAKWCACEYGRVYTYFDSLSESEVECIESFCRDFRKYILIGAKGEVATHFAGGLDFCLALDFNFPSPEEAAKGNYTRVGGLEFHAKYRNCATSRACLVQELKTAFARIPAPQVKEAWLTYVPPGPAKHKGFYLPRMAAEGLVRHPQEEGSELYFLGCHLLNEKADIKNAPLDAKIDEWETILAEEGIQLSSSVDNCVVYVVDDLYQSGVSINAFARFLKSKGASHVLGLVCVKSLRDTDNV